MRGPPSLARLPSYPVTGGVGLMAIAVSAMTLSGRWSIGRFDVGPTTFRSQPWRLFTAVLPHLDLPHIAFNVYWLWVFGTLLEEKLGHLRLLALVLLFAAGSAAAEYALFVGGVGLSGVGYGLFGMLWVLSARDERFSGAIDKPTAQIFVGWFLFCILTTYMGVMAVANVAHGVGAILGVLVGVAMTAPAWPRRALATAAIPALLAASLAGATTLRTRVNLTPDKSENQSFQLGYEAIQEGRFDDAIRFFRDALAMKGDNAGAWYNIGIAYEGTHRADEALAAYRRSYELQPHDANHRSAFAGIDRRLARQAERRGDHESAIPLLRSAVEVTPGDGYAWFELSMAYRAAGKSVEADAALDEAIRHESPAEIDGGSRRRP